MYELNENINIKEMIFTTRGIQVMLDSDLAKLYGCKNGTKEINQAVKNNPDKFPKRYSFRISENEKRDLKSKILTSKYELGGSRKGATVFTEQGIYMLATILKTKKATEVTIKIMDTFVEMRKYINKNNEISNKISVMENLLLDHDLKLSELFDKFDNRLDFKNHLVFNGKVYDAYSLLIDIINKSSKKIIIIDNYVDKITLDILSKKNINVTVLLITDKNKSRLTKTDIEKFNKEYPMLKVKYTNIFHDRFIILDNKELYHLGASLKDLGNKVFAINKIEDNTVIDSLIKKINNLMI